SGQLQQAATEQQQQDIGRLPPHRLPPRTTHHAATAQAMATTNVSGANRSANGRPNVPAWRLISLTSTAGPTTRNTNFGSSGKPAREATTNASASLHSASNPASTAITSTPSTTCSPRNANQPGGISTFIAAAIAAPSTRKPPASTRSARAVSVNARQR